MMNEPLIYTEQGVVYLFSRYWHEIKELKKFIEKITDTHTHFPDFEFFNKITKRIEGLEFEYNLSGFNNHLNDLDSLEEENIKSILVVYWNEDCDKKEFEEALRKNSIKGKFECLKNYFTPYVERGDKNLRSYWRLRLSEEEKIRQVYTYEEIKKEFENLDGVGTIKHLNIKDKLYRTLGWDIESSDFVEWSHWETIHFFTTPSRFSDEEVPSKIFVKPKGYKYFVGYFDISNAFRIEKDNAQLKKFFKDVYFYEYDNISEDSICFIYKKFNLLSFTKGKEIYKLLLKNNIKIHTTGSKKIESKELINNIDGILKQEEGESIGQELCGTDGAIQIRYFLFSTHDRKSFKESVEEEKFWGTKNNKDAFKDLDINRGDKVVFYCAEEKGFIAECEITEPPKSILECKDLNDWKDEECFVPVVVRLKKIRDLNKPLDEENWKLLNTFKHLENRKSVSASLESKPRREIDIQDYNFITG